ncbi:MAG: hypothetical protein AABX72_01040 [Nanoarchaeota archaeon]
MTFEGLEALLKFVDADVRMNLIEDHGYSSPLGHRPKYERYVRTSPYLQIRCYILSETDTSRTIHKHFMQLILCTKPLVLDLLRTHQNYFLR